MHVYLCLSLSPRYLPSLSHNLSLSLSVCVENMSVKNVFFNKLKLQQSGAPERCFAQVDSDGTCKHTTRLERLARDKRSSLLWRGITCGRESKREGNRSNNGCKWIFFNCAHVCLSLSLSPPHLPPLSLSLSLSLCRKYARQKCLFNKSKLCQWGKDWGPSVPTNIRLGWKGLLATDKRSSLLWRGVAYRRLTGERGRRERQNQ